MKRILPWSHRLALCACLLFTAQFGRASSIEYHVDIDTSALAGNPSGPFSLDFQLNDGTGLGDGNNTATINNFVFGSGSASGSANLFGGASGDLSSGVKLIDTSAFNEFYQTFAAGNKLGFDVLLTLNSDAGPTPDAFSLAILDNGLANIPTSGFADSLLFLNLGASPSLETGSSASPVVTITASPVPDSGSSAAMFSMALTALGTISRFVRRSRQAC